MTDDESTIAMKSTVLDVPGWHKITHFEDPQTGLSAIVSVHDATLGPACGGCRVYPYASFEQAVEDVKNLSRGMTYKNAMGGIPFGGGKAVIIANPATDKTPDMMRALGRAIDSLGGLYYTAEDSGMSEADIQAIREVTPYAAGTTRNGIGGNPSPFTARGVLRGIEAAVRHKMGRDSLKDIRVGVLGVGAVGMALCEHLHGAGATLVVADVNANAVREAEDRFGAKAVSVDDIYHMPMDVFAPCALGGAINETTLPKLTAKIVAGAANNQLATPDMGDALKARNILYAPDYVINAVGVISVGLEILGQWTPDELNARVDKIATTLSEIFSRADTENRSTHEIADMMANEIIQAGRKRP